MILFHEDDISKGRFYLTGKYLESLKLNFPNYQELNNLNVEGCIGFLKGKEFALTNCFSLDVVNIKSNDKFISIDFVEDKELDITNATIDKSLYKFARQSNWINGENKFCPTLCILNKSDFDLVRKGSPNIRKISNNSAEIDKLKEDSDWQGLCNKFEPLESLHEKHEIWTNSDDLYNIAFACSKRGEPQNGMEKNRNHIATVKRYRELSIYFFKRCCEIQPEDFRYASALAYRYYLNVMELSKPKGRRDGKVTDEISEALLWLGKALEMNPNSIKDNYRKGKIILDKEIQNLLYSPHEWTKEFFLDTGSKEKEAVDCLEKVLSLFENLTDDYKKRYLNEYVKSLYSLGCYYLEKPQSIWNEYISRKLLHVKVEHYISKQDMEYIALAKDYFEKCLGAEDSYNFEEDTNIDHLIKISDNWAISSMDKFYRLGMTFFEMFFIRRLLCTEDERIENYKQKSEKYMNIAKGIGDKLRSKGLGARNTWFINEKLACYYILCDKYDNAIRLTERSHDSFIKNTYAIALMFSGTLVNYNKAEVVLKEAISDNYNKAKDTSISLLAVLYKLCDRESDLETLLMEYKDKMKSSGKRLIYIVEKDEIYYENR